jgi:dTDP-4-amino-4,6-dideoxygalactose transaminase
MIPTAIPNITGREADYLLECVRSGFVSSVGPFVNRLEEMTAEATGATACAATSSGTTGLHAALTAVGVSQGDLVLAPSFSFIASANAIAHCGAMPWFVDIAPDSWCMCANGLEAALREECTLRDGRVIHSTSGRRVAAIMPVYVLGNVADMALIRSLAQEFGIPVVADAAAAIGARYKGFPLGGLADLSVISFNGNKTITAGSGGAVVGTDRMLVDLVRHLTTTARKGPDYVHDRVGFNYRMTNLQAAVGCAQLERLDEFVGCKRRIRRYYDERITGRSWVRPFPRPDWTESSCWLSGIVVEQADPGAIRTMLNALGVESRPFWQPIHQQAPYLDAPHRSLAVTETVWSKILTLPSSTAISDAELDQVIMATEAALGPA